MPAEWTIISLIYSSRTPLWYYILMIFRNIFENSNMTAIVFKKMMEELLNYSSLNPCTNA